MTSLEPERSTVVLADLYSRRVSSDSIALDTYVQQLIIGRIYIMSAVERRKLWVAGEGARIH